MPVTALLGLLLGISELGLALFKRASRGAADQGSLGLIWVVILTSLALAFFCAAALPGLRFGPASTWQLVGGLMFAAGVALRWYAVIQLGRFFTVNVAIAPDHRLIESGPYRWVRHPSYSGSLLAFVGLGIGFGNYASLAALVLPTFWVFSRRMGIEEEALRSAFGDQYRDYMRRTKRLIPAVY